MKHKFLMYTEIRNKRNIRIKSMDLIRVDMHRKVWKKIWLITTVIFNFLNQIKFEKPNSKTMKHWHSLRPDIIGSDNCCHFLLFFFFVFFFLRISVVPAFKDTSVTCFLTTSETFPTCFHRCLLSFLIIFLQVLLMNNYTISLRCWQIGFHS